MLHFKCVFAGLGFVTSVSGFLLPPPFRNGSALYTRGAEGTLAAGQANPSLFLLNISAQVTHDCGSAGKRELNKPCWNASFVPFVFGFPVFGPAIKTNRSTKHSPALLSVKLEQDA